MSEHTGNLPATESHSNLADGADAAATFVVPEPDIEAEGQRPSGVGDGQYLVAKVKVGPALDLLAATALKDEILEVMNTADGITVDAANVETLTTPCVQILVAAGQAMEERDQKFYIESATDAVRAAFRDLGLGSEFERWSSKT